MSIKAFDRTAIIIDTDGNVFRFAGQLNRSVVLFDQRSRLDHQYCSAFPVSTPHGKIRSRRFIMIVTKQDLERFHKFAVSRVSNSEDELTWRQLFELWRLDNPSDEESAEDVAAIQESLDAIAAGRMRLFSEFDAEFRARHGITDER